MADSGLDVLVRVELFWRFRFSGSMNIEVCPDSVTSFWWQLIGAAMGRPNSRGSTTRLADA